ncbi:ROK family glucokinase [Ornithinimicrobium sp. Y1847]|uniref:ROK family glucokinase n=1 Tax=Ornithinimicrobium sp. Y1847 TaxID=3405419 RepID=UPI003B676D59
MTAPTIGVDVGGTRIKAGVLDAAGQILDRLTRPTEPLAADAEDAIVAVVEDLIARHRGRLEGAAAPNGGDIQDIAAVGIGAAGFVDAARGVVVFAPHLSWRDEPLRERIASRLSLPVVVDNDANAACWAEHLHGAGRGAAHLVMVTLGTGIGGAHLVDGELRRGQHGLAGEYGHLLLVPDGRACECGNTGCWEQYASGTVMRRRAQEVVRRGGVYAERLRQACDGQPERLEGEDVTRLARAGDPASVELLAEVGRWLGLGLANLAAALDPGAFVVGGGASEAGDLLLEPARAALARQLAGRGHRPVPPVYAAHLGVDAGLVGAAQLARVG